MDANIEQNDENFMDPSTVGGTGEKPTSRPGGFKPGYDPRRHTGGSTPSEVRNFNKTLRQMIVEEGLKVSDYMNPEGKMRIQRVVERMYDEAELGNDKYTEMIFERVEGKITQPVEQIGSIPVLVIRGASIEELK